MKKRILALLLAVLMLSGLLAGCGTQPQQGAPAESEAQTAETPEDAAAPEEDPGEETAAPEEGSADEEFFLPREEGCNQLTLYWSCPDADYDSCDVWVWSPDREGHGELFHPCAYGVKAMINVPADVERVGFIVRRDCSEPGGSSWGSATKDFDADRWAEMDGDTEIYLRTGEAMQYKSKDGGVTLEPIRAFKAAGLISPTHIRYTISPAKRIESLSEIAVRDASGRSLEIVDLSSLGNEIVSGTITLAESVDLSGNYTVEIDGYGAAPVVPTEIFDSPEFIAEYTYDGDDLGATVKGGRTYFKLWAPTASAVVLHLFDSGDGGEAFASVEMARGAKGVWSGDYECGYGVYYTYSVTTSLGTQEAVDPYARSAGVNGERGMVVDLRATDPEGFRASRFYDGISTYPEAVIWEVHVRDFSNKIASSQYPGKYLAFTETGLTNSAGVPVGLDYIVDLGVTHVHLQPVYDYATVDESSKEPQFNWGYDPKNYNVPEGSYSTDPSDGAVRVNEFKQMVQSLHEHGVGVVMDVVYNHTFDIDSNLNRIVPYYYYRLAADGSYSNGSGCGNETASERVMFRKYMVDSVLYWAEEYKIDGFRFDLMALHDLETMQQIERELHRVNPRALIYGEGWTGGTSALRDELRASQANIFKLTASAGAAGSIAVFNDEIRDGLKGSVFDAKDAGYVNGKVGKSTAERVIFGLQGGRRDRGFGWSVDDARVINYTSSHDNNTLWDKLKMTCPDASDEELAAMVRLAGSVVMIARGTPFFLAGEEMLRTKGGDENSYKSSDAVNNIDWEALEPGSLPYETSRFYRALIEMRRGESFFTDCDVSAEYREDGLISVVWTRGGDTVAVGFINPNESAVTVALPEGEWTAPEVFGGGTASGSAEVPARSVIVLKAA